MHLALVFRYTGHPNSSQAVPSFSIVDINNEFLLPDALPNAQHIHYQLVGTALGNQMFTIRMTWFILPGRFLFFFEHV